MGIMIPGTMILTGMTTIQYTGHLDTHGDIILHGASASTGGLRIIIHPGIVHTGMVAIITATGTHPTITGVVTDMATMTHTMEAITEIIIPITIITEMVLFTMGNAETFLPEEAQQPEIL